MYITFIESFKYLNLGRYLKYFQYGAITIILIWILLFTLLQIEHKHHLRGDIFTREKYGLHHKLSNATNYKNHLILVPGHAVLRIENIAIADSSDNGWYLLDYQKNVGYADIIKSHIQRGLQELSTFNSTSILIFSGGETRKDVGPISEGLSYYLLSKAKNWLSHPNLLSSIYLEEYAKDSFENLLYSICRFYEVTGNYPSYITIIGFDFKQYRFSELHRKALYFPTSQYTYIGLTPTHPNFNHETAEKGEKIAVEEFQQDMYGCHDLTLKTKRLKRNPFKRTSPYELTCPEIRPLLDWCDSQLFDQPYLLPWYHQS